MGHFLTSPATNSDIYSLSQQTFDFSFSLFFFSRMEEMVKSMMQYKTKIEQLKQEKSSLSITYEVYICHVALSTGVIQLISVREIYIQKEL